MKPSNVANPHESRIITGMKKLIGIGSDIAPPPLHDR
jgi:hypothetical protein